MNTGTKLVGIGAGGLVMVFLFYIIVWPMGVLSAKGIILSVLIGAAGALFTMITIAVMEKKRRVAELNRGDEA